MKLPATLISTWNGHKVTIKDGAWGGPMHLSKHYDKRLLAAFVAFRDVFDFCVHNLYQ